jgi:hypothetical protein
MPLFLATFALMLFDSSRNVVFSGDTGKNLAQTFGHFFVPPISSS